MSFIIKSIHKHLLIGSNAYPLPLINYMSHDLSKVTLKSTTHEVILHGLRETTSERRVISHDPAVTSMILMVQKGRKCITYIYYIIKQLLTYGLVDIECY